MRKINGTIQGLFNNTSLDCADTYKYIKAIDNIITTSPKIGFYQWIKTNIIPSRFGRACCRVFKEVATSKLFENNKTIMFMGIRKEESNTRSNYNDEIKNPNLNKFTFLSQNFKFIV